MPRARPKKVEEAIPIGIEETKYIRCPVPLSSYRSLVKLAADSTPLKRFNDYCADVLIIHATNSTKGKR